MTELTKKEKLPSKTIKFVKLFFWTSLLIGGIGGTGMLIGTMIYFTSQYHIAYLIWICLIILSLGYICYKHKKFFTKDNLKNVFKKTKLTAKKIIKFSLYSTLILIGIGILFLLGGWIISILSATTIIIILLILILLK